MVVRSSLDGGLHWDETLVWADLADYSSLQVLRDGRVGILYTRNKTLETVFHLLPDFAMPPPETGRAAVAAGPTLHDLGLLGLPLGRHARGCPDLSGPLSGPQVSGPAKYEIVPLPKKSRQGTYRI